jgi:hypothetical protein
MEISLLTSLRISLAITILLTVPFLTSIAQTQNEPITVTTDKTSYVDGSTMIISGTVAEQIGIPISVIIKDRSQNIVYIAQTSPNSDNTYSTQVIVGGDMWKTVGTYEIDVTYGGKDKTSKTTFEFMSAIKQPALPNTENQTNQTEAIPEFGPLAISIFSISIFMTIILYARVKF